MVLLLLDVCVWASYSSDKAGDAKLGGADAVVVAKGSTALADHHRLHVARHRVEAGLGHAGRFRQEGHSVRLQHHLVALVGLWLQPGAHRDNEYLRRMTALAAAACSEAA